MKYELMIKAIESILHEIEEGVHIVDKDGVTLVYNDSMEKIEGLEKKQVVGKHLLDVFPNWTKENSTLLTALENQQAIVKEHQTYLNLKGKKIRTNNTTYPVYSGDTLIGAVEIAKDLTEVSNLSEEIISLRQQLIKPKRRSSTGKQYYSFENIVGREKCILEAIKIGQRASGTVSSVMIIGETGTGKELFAQSIHEMSDRVDKPFIAQNCAAIPESLLEAILFGATKGSFTGAQDRPGLFEQADGGTLFLDEINSMPIPLQAKILRVLQESYVRRIGGQKDIPVDVRIIAASNEDPRTLVEEGLFRKDLYYRINVIQLRIPSLKERAGDISLLVDHFIRMYNQRLGKDVWMLSQEIMEAFKLYSWPGNVRELQNFIESAMNMIGDEHVINREHLPNHVEEILEQRSEKADTVNYNAIESLPDYLGQLESDIIAFNYNKHDGNVTKTAQKLGLSRQNLQHKLKKYNLI
ncbi:sigma-54 interaction domain-containing protein [Fusibacter sp. JL216-2]|uniref:sigma-54 interaction domain-containing protein n=1 Tax=Fusibacter sp. JL216-2 TaxID=3071453 RepID=UPI003D33C2D6